MNIFKNVVVLATSFVLVSALVIPTTAKTSAPSISCGGIRPIPYGLVMGLIGAAKEGYKGWQPRSLVAVAAIVHGNSLTPEGWIALDDHGDSWMALAKSASQILRKFWNLTPNVIGAKTEPSTLPYRFALLSNSQPRLPDKSYSLAECISVHK